MRRFILVLTAAILVGFAGVGNATLVDRGTDILGNHLIYDTVENLTWYDYTYSPGSGVGWSAANAWAGNLSITAGAVTYDDWRLPTTVSFSGPSEMKHLFLVELPSASPNIFHNLTAPRYWSGTDATWSEWDEDTGEEIVHVVAFTYRYPDTYNWRSAPSLRWAALAVRSGDVLAASPVPEPGALLLLGSALAGLIAWRKVKGGIS